MGSFDRSKKSIHLWKKAAIHFALCFTMGFFTGFAPTSTTSFFSGHAVPYHLIKNLGISANPNEALQKTREQGSLNRSLMSESPLESNTTPNGQLNQELTEDEEIIQIIKPEQQLIIITTTHSGDRLQGAFLSRLANTLRLVPPPLLWVVVEARSDAPKTDELLRKTGIMFRHLTFSENFTDPEAEVDHQRNVALNHIEYHRLDGIVHFAGISNTYDLQFFEEIRDIEVFGAWQMALVSPNVKEVVVEGPICSSSKVVGWQWKDFSNVTKYAKNQVINADMNNGTISANPPMINVSGFAFNSSILWDPERWGRPSSVPDTSQDSIKFVQQVVLEDETKLMAIPEGCSRIMMWQLRVRTIQNNRNR